MDRYDYHHHRHLKDKQTRKSYKKEKKKIWKFEREKKRNYIGCGFHFCTKKEKTTTKDKNTKIHGSENQKCKPQEIMILKFWKAEKVLYGGSFNVLFFFFPFFYPYFVVAKVALARARVASWPQRQPTRTRREKPAGHERERLARAPWLVNSDRLSTRRLRAAIASLHL